MSWQFATAGRILFGRGTFAELGVVAARLVMSRALIVTDQNLVALGLADRAREALEQSGVKVTIYDGCQPEPPLECTVEATALASKVGANGLIALGGGSNIDIAKMVA
ncbi:MAG: iron-containing alcohol dehydrogenase, partial [Pirellulaceae bacterium]|nr:iron-containing alcohol dehydrogenase [Pirellulaceae bacterium]